MKRFLLAGCTIAAIAAIAAAPTFAQQKTIKIGFISTFSGPVAAIGNDMRNSFELGLDHHGRKLGGLPVEVIYEDDQIKPEVGVQKTQKLIESDKVDFMVGYIWSNVALASLKPLVDSKTITFITNAGASQIIVNTSGGRETFTVESDAMVRQGSRTIKAAELQSHRGERVKVRYRESGGVKRAEWIVLAAPPAKKARAQ